MEGTLGLEWTSVRGISGLQPRLALGGSLIARGYGYGSVISVTVDVTATQIQGSHSYLGTTASRSYVLNWPKQRIMQENPPPEDETNWTTEVFLALPPHVIEGLEDRRQGKEFTLQLDTRVLMIDRGVPLAPLPDQVVKYQVHPTMEWQEMLRIRPEDWSEVLTRWERGAALTVLLPLPEVAPNQERASIAHHLRSARQKIDGGDYSGAMTEARKALEILRRMSPGTKPIPTKAVERDARQRIHAVIESLYALGSAPLHTDDSVKNFQPMRADAVSLVGSTIAVVQQVFAHLDIS